VKFLLRDAAGFGDASRVPAPYLEMLPMRPTARLALMALLLPMSALTALAVETNAPPPEDFCELVPDGEYLNPNSCHSFIVCKKKKIDDIKKCPDGQVIDIFKPTFPKACVPAETTEVLPDCTRKPLTKKK